MRERDEANTTVLASSLAKPFTAMLHVVHLFYLTAQSVDGTCLIIQVSQTAGSGRLPVDLVPDLGSRHPSGSHRRRLSITWVGEFANCRLPVRPLPTDAVPVLPDGAYDPAVMIRPGTRLGEVSQHTLMNDRPYATLRAPACFLPRIGSLDDEGLVPSLALLSIWVWAAV